MEDEEAGIPEKVGHGGIGGKVPLSMSASALACTGGGAQANVSSAGAVLLWGPTTSLTEQAWASRICV